MLRVVSRLVSASLIVAPLAAGADDAPHPAAGWRQPPPEVMEVLHAPQLPWVWTSPSGTHLLLADPVTYPPLAELAAPKHALAGIRVDPVVGAIHGRHGGTSPRLVAVEGGAETRLSLPAGAEVHDVAWTADGRRCALTVRHADHMGLWVGSVAGDHRKIDALKVNPLLGTGAAWLPDQNRLLVRRVPGRGAPPAPPAVPAGPGVQEGKGASARSTYESRNLLESAHDDALFSHYAASELVVVDPETAALKTVGPPAVYATAEFSPDGRYLLVERLLPPWSHAVPWWRFARVLEVWDGEGNPVATVATLPVADQVPIHGVPVGPREPCWRATAPHELFWIEALDGGNPVAKAAHRDRLMRLRAPFTGEPEEAFRAEHRIEDWQDGWGAEGGTLVITQRERIRRRVHTWVLDVDAGTSRPRFDLNEDDRYRSPGRPVRRPLPNGQWVLRQQGDAVFFSGRGATDRGDRPFLDLRHLKTGATERLFRCDPSRYEAFVAFAGADDRFVLRSESAVEAPNYWLATLGRKVAAPEGEASRALTRVPVTRFADPTPQLRKIEKRLVRYQRADGVPLSFELHLPPGYREGTRLPTVLYAYPLEYSDPATAGQVSASVRRFSRISGASHLFFLLQGYAVLDATTMPMIGDPETTYDTFVSQLVADPRWCPWTWCATGSCRRWTGCSSAAGSRRC